MGVKGLWKLLDGTGQPVTLESLEGKILAIDISLWLNMAVKGMRDIHGHSANDAHLITLFNRICKLLYFGVKPIFVFDGKAPLIKRRVIQQRQESRIHNAQKSRVASQKLLQNYLKRQVLNMAIKSPDKKEGLNKNPDSATSNLNQQDPIKEIARAKKNEEEDLFILPEIKYKEELLNSSDDEKEEQWLKRSATRESVYGSAMMGDFKQMMAIDVDSKDFKSLPTDIQHELLNDIKEIRKRRRTQFEKMPENSKSFSSYQLKGLLAKRSITDKIEQVEKRMQEDNATTMSALGYDDNLYDADSIKASQLISDENTRFILISKLSKKQKNKGENVAEFVEINHENTESRSSQENQVHSKSTSNLLNQKTEVENSNHEQTNPSDEPLMESEDNLELVASKANSFPDPQEKDLLLDQDHISDQEDTSKNSSIICLDSGIDNDLLQTSSLSLDKQTDPISRVVNENPIELDVHISSQTLSSNSDILPIQIFEKPVNDFEAQTNSLNGVDNVDVATSSNNKQPVSEQVQASSTVSVVDSQEDSDDDFVEVQDVVSSVSTDHVDDNVSEIKSEDITENSASESDNSFEANPWMEFGDEDVTTIQEQMDAEDVALVDRMKASARAARDLSDVATTESQQLLQMFGIPFLVSPQEAESQCAYLDACGLTTGTITDDSDVLLFGGQTVYKSVFDKKHDPSMYSMKSIKAELGLERSHLINIAMCSGSDYAVGIENVGPVAALEIMKEFPGDGLESLINFKAWWSSAHEQVHVPVVETKIKSRLRKINVPSDFPSSLVVDAYLNPVIEQSKESFTWGIPDLDEIRNFLIERLHWTKGKVDETLLPVLKKTSERNNKQRLMSDYITKIPPPLQATRKKKSKRVSRAIFGISESNSSLSEVKKEKKTIKRKIKQKKALSKPVNKRSSNEKQVCLSESSSSDS